MNYKVKSKYAQTATISALEPKKLKIRIDPN